jgi:hypothetical protein
MHFFTFFIHFYLNTKQVYLCLCGIPDQLFFKQRRLLSLIKALHTKLLIDKKITKVEYNIIDSSRFVYWVNIFFVFEERF